MKLGIGLPNTMAHETDRALMLDWARLADEAGFDVLGTIDKPNYDSWEPLATLAGVAGVTERIRLATTILQLPNRNEVLVAKQAAVIDQLSAGRLVLGVAQGGREDDFDVLAPTTPAVRPGSSARSSASARSGRKPQAADRERGFLGPAPVHVRRPDLGGRVHAEGGRAGAARRRRISLRDGRLGGDGRADAGHPRGIRGDREGGRDGRRVGVCRRGDDSQSALDEATHHVLRYYGQLWTEPELIHHGPASKLAAEIAAYDRAGLDVLIVVPRSRASTRSSSSPSTSCPRTVDEQSGATAPPPLVPSGAWRSDGSCDPRE